MTTLAYSELKKFGVKYVCLEDNDLEKGLEFGYNLPK